MKFVCNNCGFSAEVPDRRSTCPMCASSNVTVAAQTEIPAVQEKPVVSQPETVHQEQSEKPLTAPNDKEEKSSNTKEKERITLSDDFFDAKAKEDQELASLLKELDPEAGEIKKSSSKNLKTIGIVTVSSLVVLIVVLFFVFSGDSGSGEKSSVSLTETENESAEAKQPETKSNEPEKAVPAVETKAEEIPGVKKEEKAEEKLAESTANTEQAKPEEKAEPKKIVEPERVAEPEKKAEPEEKKTVVIKKVEEPKTEPAKPKVESKKPETVRNVKKVPEPVKKTYVKQTAPKVEETEVSGDAFNSFVQAGHKALSEKRYTDALHEYKNASRINPSNGSIYKFLGIAYAYLQNQEQACVNYKKYIQLSPNAPDKAQVEAFIKACP